MYVCMYVCVYVGRDGTSSERCLNPTPMAEKPNSTRIYCQVLIILFIYLFISKKGGAVLSERSNGL